MNFRPSRAKIFLTIVMFLFCTSLRAGEKNITTSYQDTILKRRTAEASVLWSEMLSDGVTASSVIGLDFVYFSDTQEDADRLKKQLSENYTVTVSPAGQKGYWLVSGTTRPKGRLISSSQWLGWVEFMVSVGFSHNCVFSVWSAYEPKLKKTWASEHVVVE